MKRFAVIHWGARLHYAVPAVLHSAGLLHRLYTDAHADMPLMQSLRVLPEAARPKVLRRLLARKIPADIPSELVRSYAGPSLRYELKGRFNPKLRMSARRAYEAKIGAHDLTQCAIADNFGGADALYVHPCASTDAIRVAKERKMFVVLEAISHPFNMQVQRAEHERLHLDGPEGWEYADDNIAFFAEEAKMADLVLAASAYVKNGLVDLGVDPAKVAIVPYGLDAGFYTEPSRPQAGRILYVGTVDPHKGIVYLAEAARNLRKQNPEWEVRAIGPISASVSIDNPLFQGINYLGQVPRTEVKKEFAAADLFVFPTLTDGFGIVLLEALFANLPIVSTDRCGDVVQPGINGLIVPAQEGAALTEAITQIVGDRNLRDRMSRLARSMHQRFTLGAYSARLIDAIGNACGRETRPSEVVR